MSYLFKIILTKSPHYLYELVPPLQRSHRYPGCFKLCVVGLNFTVTHFYRLLLMNVINWALILRTLTLMQFSAKELLAFIRPVGNSMYGIYDLFGVTLINKFQLDFRHLREHKFMHNFASTVNPLCSCTLETENAEHFFLRCQNNLSACTTLMN